MENKIIGVIQVTTNYDQFKLLKGNRHVSPGVVKNLEKEIKKRGAILQPIKVNKNMEVIDGQHRLQVAKNLNLLLPFIIDDNAKEEDLITINTTGRKWSPKDWLEYYAGKGKEDYQELIDLIEKYKSFQLSPLTAGSIATDYHGISINHKFAKVIQSGELKLNNLNNANDFLIFCMDYTKLTNQHTLNAKVIAVFYHLYRLKNFKKDIFLKKAGDIHMAISTHSTSEGIFKATLDTYNSSLKKNRIKEEYYQMANGRRAVRAAGDVKKAK